MITMQKLVAVSRTVCTMHTCRRS